MIHLNIHLFVLGFLLLVTFLAGFFARALSINMIKRKVLDLEKEKMDDHAEILLLQKKLSQKEDRQAIPPTTPVVALKENGQQDTGKNRLASQ